MDCIEVMEGVDAYKILRAYDILNDECSIILGIHYYDPDYPHLTREVFKSAKILIKQGQAIEILKVIEDSVPLNLNVRHVYAFVGGKNLLIFDDSSFISACIIHFQNEPKPDTFGVYLDYCANEFNK